MLPTERAGGKTGPISRSKSKVILRENRKRTCKTHVNTSNSFVERHLRQRQRPGNANPRTPRVYCNTRVRTQRVRETVPNFFESSFAT